MSLITKEVEIQLNASNTKYYESLGYKLPKTKKYGRLTTPKGTKIPVKTTDLPNNSHAIVEVQCDGIDCNNILKMEYRRYKKCNHDGKCYCKNCSINSSERKEKSIKTRIEKGKSFEEWCIENYRQDILNRWDCELNNCKPSEISYGTKIKYYFKCPKNIHESELKSIGDFTSGHEGIMNCKSCNSFAQWGIDNICEDFINKYWDYDKNIISPWEVSYCSSSKKVWLKCQEKDYHESYNVCVNNFTSGNCRCPYCSGKKIHHKDSLGQYIIDNLGEEFLYNIWSDKNNMSPFEYLAYSGKEVWWKCIEGNHKDYKRKISESTVRNFRCPSCSQEKNESILQEKVRLYIEDMEYTVLHEEKCTIIPKNPKTNRLLPFDNEIKELRLIVEVNGIQHYKLTNFHNLSSKHFNTTPQYELHYQRLKDRYKRIKAIQEGYYYLEIPYWMDNKKEEWKTLIDNKINEILN